MDKKEKMAANLQKNLPATKNRPIKIDKDIKDENISNHMKILVSIWEVIKI